MLHKYYLIVSAQRPTMKKIEIGIATIWLLWTAVANVLISEAAATSVVKSSSED
jgi:hypothetical protein